MTGKVLESETNFKPGDKPNSNMVKISAAKSILSYQNGSAPNSENRGCTTGEGTLEEGPTDEGSSPEDAFAAVENVNSECLDLLRKKLISDLSLAVFSCDLENKFTKMEPIKISKERQAVIQKLVVQISQLSDPEKLLLYLKLPSSTSSPFDPLRQPLNPLGNRQEIQQTIVWIKTHLEEDSEISIPKQDVYDQYLKYCENVSMKPLSTADFGKVMKQVYPGVRPRRLGTRGNSRYCYSGMRNTCKLPTPILPRSSMENSRNVSNGCAANVSPFLPADANKFKKVDKPKRKWPSSACRSEKCSSSKKSPPLDQEKTSACPLKASKRPKAQKETEVTGETFDCEEAKKVIAAGEVKSEEVDLGIIKCEDCSDNSFSAFDIESELRSDYGDYLKKTEEAEDNSISNSTDMENTDMLIQSRTNLEIQNRVYESEGDVAINKQSHSLTTAVKSGTMGNGNSVGDETAKASNKIAEVVNGLSESRETVSEKQKGSKAKCKKSSSLVKHGNKNPKKSSYVPIQPKPAEGPKLSIRFRSSQTSAEKKKDSEGVGACEESDSQEPEEEIVRYFKHLDETDMNAANGFVDEAVKNIDSNPVQINSISQVMASTRNPVPYGTRTDEIINQQILQSQSCFGNQEGRGFSLEKKPEPMYQPRSQSPVESNDPSHPVAPDSDPGLDGRKNKISHLRILLEKSIPSSVKNPYSRSLSVRNGVNPSAPNSIGQVVSRESNFVLSNVKPDRDLFKLNGLKVNGKSSPFVPQSPNTRTKYFSFTPISPGPLSPMKTASGRPFVSPRNTPVPRSRQNSHNDHFLSPSEGKPGYQGENFFNFNKSTAVNSRVRGCRSPTISQGSRPRSYSSTNFYRSRSRRLLSKPTGFDRPNHLVPKNHVQSLAANGFAMNSSFAAQPMAGQLLGGESLSDEVQNFLENTTKLAETQVATIRSRSVPLNRMVGESNWLPTQASPVFPHGYFDAGNTSDQGKHSNMVPDSDGHSIKVISAASISGFVDNNGEMASLSSEIFTGDPTIPSLNDHYFPEDFQRSGDENFVEQPFSEDSTFGSSKLDLNSNGTFDNTFPGDSDVAITENIKSYLPDFDGLDNKNLVDPSNERPDASQEKLFKNALYGGGNDNLKDPVITSFKPVLMSEITSSPGSPVLNFFGNKMNEDSQQLIEFFDFED